MNNKKKETCPVKYNPVIYCVVISTLFLIYSFSVERKLCHTRECIYSIYRTKFIFRVSSLRARSYKSVRFETLDTLRLRDNQITFNTIKDKYVECVQMGYIYINVIIEI